MGSNIDNINSVLLTKSATAYNFTANGIAGLTISDLNRSSADTLVAGGNGQILTGGGAGNLTMDAADHADVLFQNNGTSFDGDILQHLVKGDAIDLTSVKFGAKTTVGFAYDSTSQMTTMSVFQNGAQKTAIELLGQYGAANFSVGGDSGGAGTLITLEQQLPDLTKPH
jgi:hypothetical protein